MSAKTTVNPSPSNTKPRVSESFVSAKIIESSPSSSGTKPIMNESFERRGITCHHCGNKGHIRPNCYRLRRELQKKGQIQRTQKLFVPRSVVLDQRLHRPMGGREASSSSLAGSGCEIAISVVVMNLLQCRQDHPLVTSAPRKEKSRL